MIHQDNQVVVPASKQVSKWILLLKSRKFWAAVIGLGLVIFRGFYPSFPVSDALLEKAIFVVIAYIVGTGLEDSTLLRGIQ
ncbi:MAG TPA: hypothetical protein VF813_06995 [Anaerolineaceae bacterium]